jgi:Ca2+-binding EF-hand superfamily protein
MNYQLFCNIVIPQNTEAAIMSKIKLLMSKAERRGLDFHQTFLMFDTLKKKVVTAADFRKGMRILLGASITEMEIMEFVDHLGMSKEANISYEKVFLEVHKNDPKLPVAAAATTTAAPTATVTTAASTTAVAKTGRQVLRELMDKTGVSVKDLQQNFEVSDLDGSGTLTTVQFNAAVKKLIPDVTEADLSTITKHYTSVVGPSKDVIFKTATSPVNSTINPKIAYGIVISDMEQGNKTSGLGVVINGLKKWWKMECKRIPDLVKYFAQKESSGNGATVTRRVFRESLVSLEAPVHESEWIMLLDHLDSRRLGYIDVPTFMREIDAIQNSTNHNKIAIREKLRHAVYLKGDEFDIRGIFSDLDFNNSGSITRREFQSGLAQIGISPTNDELACLIEEFDKNNDGYIDYYEFSSYVLFSDKEFDQMASRIASRLHEATHENTYVYDVFQLLDPDASGFVTPSEFKEATKKLQLPLKDTELGALIMKFKSEIRENSISYRDFVKFIEINARHVLKDKSYLRDLHIHEGSDRYRSHHRDVSRGSTTDLDRKYQRDTKEDSGRYSSSIPPNKGYRDGNTYPKNSYEYDEPKYSSPYRERGSDRDRDRDRIQEGRRDTYQSSPGVSIPPTTNKSYATTLSRSERVRSEELRLAYKSSGTTSIYLKCMYIYVYIY